MERASEERQVQINDKVVSGQFSQCQGCARPRSPSACLQSITWIMYALFPLASNGMHGQKKRDYWLRADSTKTMQRYARCESKFALIMDLFVYICVHLSWRTRFTRRILARSGSKSRELSVEALAKWNSTHALQPLAPSPFHFCNIGTSQRNKWATLSCTHKRIKMFARRRAVLRRCSYNNNIRYWRAGVYIHFMYYKRRTKRRFVCCMLIAWWFRNWKSNAIPVW